MKLPIFLDPIRANEPDVIEAYEASHALSRRHAKFPELEVLIARAAAIKGQLDRASLKQKAKRRVLLAKLRHANHNIRDWLQDNGMK